MPIANIASVLQVGILSHERAAKIQHRSVAMEDVQEKRDAKSVPGGLKLHQYANLYLHARNPMLYKRKEDSANLCVLRISLDVLQVPGVVIADSNASSPYARFLEPAQIDILDLDVVYAMDWNRQHANDPYGYRAHKAKKCAEVLVPHQVEVKYLLGAYVTDQDTAGKLKAFGFDLPVTIDSQMFFR